MEFESIIGLEVHAQLATFTKMFCSCVTEFTDFPNQNTCPVCLGLPGALPTINRQAIDFAIKIGLATHCKIRLQSQFARKNYFYPDLPKAYQTSQFDLPICENGWIEIEVEGQSKRIGITRIHLEEDAGKLIHKGEDPTASYIDLNRAGVPLIEIVSEPDIRTSAEAKAYMEKIHSLVTYLGICNGNMEKGNLRCDANISVRLQGETQLNTRTETKNLNSFRYIQQAIDYEIERQIDLTLNGEEVIQQTRLWNADQKKSFATRSKENANDYRYFPCPDLPVLKINQELIDQMQSEIPELPDAKQERYLQEFQLSAREAKILVKNQAMALFFEAVIAEQIPPKIAANWIIGDFLRLLNESKTDLTDSQITPLHLAKLIHLLQKNVISSKIAKTVFEEMFTSGKDPDQIVQSKGLQQVSDEASLEKICQEIIDQNDQQVQEYRNGKEKVFGFFVGQVMKKTKGQANPQIINQILKKLLK